MIDPLQKEDIMSYIIEDEREREALRERVRERKLRCWARSNCRAYQTPDVKSVPQELRMNGWENILLDECKKINREIGIDLTDDP